MGGTMDQCIHNFDSVLHVFGYIPNRHSLAAIRERLRLPF
jgi:hypothetical protein